MISLRIRAGEDRQAIAKQCGTSVEMLERSYSLATEDLEDEGPRPAADERSRAPQLAPRGRRRRPPGRVDDAHGNQHTADCAQRATFA
jgi:hypothetical protein